MFIVIDGIDGSGKATQLKLVYDELIKLGKKVKILDYPRYGEKSAYFIEKYLNGEYGKDVSAKQASIFYALDRFDDSFNFKNELNNYDYIISNRYVSASMIHQSCKIKDYKERLDFIKWLEDLEYNILGIPKPDKIIFLDVSPEVSSNLVLQKEKRNYIKGDKKKDLHEEDENHIKNAYNVANEISSIFPERIKIDCVKNGNILDKKIILESILKKII